MSKPKLNLDKVRKFVDRKEGARRTNIREAYYGLALKGEPRLEHVYKDRSMKAALELELKPSKCHPKELWNWKKP